MFGGNFDEVAELFPLSVLDLALHRGRENGRRLELLLERTPLVDAAAVLASGIALPVIVVLNLGEIRVKNFLVLNIMRY